MDVYKKSIDYLPEIKSILKSNAEDLSKPVENTELITRSKKKKGTSLAKSGKWCNILYIIKILLRSLSLLVLGHFLSFAGYYLICQNSNSMLHSSHASRQIVEYFHFWLPLGLNSCWSLAFTFPVNFHGWTYLDSYCHKGLAFSR